MCLYMHMYFYNSCLKIILTHVKCTIWKINYKHLYYFKTYIPIMYKGRREAQTEKKKHK